MAADDLTKLVLLSENPAFKNQNLYTGSFVISGSTNGGGITQRSFNRALTREPDLLSVLFNGPTDTIFGSDPRPGTAWFKDGYIWVLGTNVGDGYIDYPLPFKPEVRIDGSSATIILTTVQQFTSVLSLTPTTFYYRLRDYSVF